MSSPDTAGTRAVTSARWPRLLAARPTDTFSPPATGTWPRSSGHSESGSSRRRPFALPTPCRRRPQDGRRWLFARLRYRRYTTVTGPVVGHGIVACSRADTNARRGHLREERGRNYTLEKRRENREKTAERRRLGGGGGLTRTTFCRRSCYRRRAVRVATEMRKKRERARVRLSRTAAAAAAETRGPDCGRPWRARNGVYPRRRRAPTPNFSKILIKNKIYGRSG